MSECSLTEVEEKDAVVKTLICMFQQVGNKPSTAVELEPLYEEMKDGIRPRKVGPREPCKAVRTYLAMWNQLARKAQLGKHAVGKDGCTLDDYHRVCKSREKGKLTRYWINKSLAQVVHKDLVPPCKRAKNLKSIAIPDAVDEKKVDSAKVDSESVEEKSEKSKDIQDMEMDLLFDELDDGKYSSIDKSDLAVKVPLSLPHNSMLPFGYTFNNFPQNWPGMAYNSFPGMFPTPMNTGPAFNLNNHHMYGTAGAPYPFNDGLLNDVDAMLNHFPVFNGNFSNFSNPYDTTRTSLTNGYTYNNNNTYTLKQSEENIKTNIEKNGNLIDTLHNFGEMPHSF
jgi:hypothetical protein